MDQEDNEKTIANENNLNDKIDGIELENQRATNRYGFMNSRKKNSIPKEFEEIVVFFKLEKVLFVGILRHHQEKRWKGFSK